jgi:hypothetical protein
MKISSPGLRDWALLGVSCVFVLLGLFILIRDPADWRGALMPITFFGVCAGTFGFNIARKLRRRRFAATSVAVAGGIKLSASNSRMLLLAAAIATPGLAIFFMPDPPLLIIGCAVIMIGASAVLLFAVLSGRIARRFLRFDPLGLTIGETQFEYVVPWDQIANLGEFEMHDNAVVGFEVLDADTLLVTPESARPKLIKLLARNRGWMGPHVVIMAGHFAVHAEALCAAIANYANDVEARAELVPKARLE